jgi:hypothetical protein
MTVSTTNARQQYSGDGSTTNFSFSFKVLTEAELQVLGVNTTGNALDGISPGETQVYTQGTNYSVSLNNPGGTVVFNSAPSAGIRITIVRQSKQTQDIDYVENDPFPAATHEEGLDRAVLRDQERRQEIERSLRIGLADDTSVDLILPTKENRRNTGLGFDSNGKPVPFSGFVNSDQVPVSSFAETLLDDTSASEARQTLGVAGQADRFAVTTGTGSTLEAVPNTPTALTTGETVFLRFHTTVVAGATLNVNSTGAKVVVDNQRNTIRSGQIFQDDYVALLFDGNLDSGNGGWVALSTNNRVFDDEFQSFYTNIQARLGYTPANVAGDTFTGTVRVNHLVKFQSKDNNGNNRNLAGINANNILVLGDANSPETRLIAKDNDSATVRGNTIWNYGNMPEITGSLAAGNTDSISLSGGDYHARLFYRRQDNGATGALTFWASGSRDRAVSVEGGYSVNSSGQLNVLAISDNSNGNVKLDVNPGGNQGLTLNINNSGTGATINYALIIWYPPV